MHQRYLLDIFIKIIGKTYLVFVYSIILGLTAFGFFYVNDYFASGTDFDSFYTAGKIVVGSDRDRLYDVEYQKSIQKERLAIRQDRTLLFKNPPFVGLLFVPLSELNYLRGYRVYFVINVLLLLIASFFLKKYIIPKDNNYYLLAFFLFWPALVSVIVGQISLLLVIISLFLYKFLKIKSYFYAGLISSLFLIKPQHIIIIPYILFLKIHRRDYLIGFGTGVLILLFISVASVGVKSLSGYPLFLLQTEEAIFGSDFKSYLTLGALLQTLKSKFGLESNFIYISNAILYFLSVVYFAIRSKKVPFEILFSSAFLLSLPFSIHAWEHDLVIIAIPLIFILEFANKARGISVKRILSLIFIILFFSFLIRYITWAFVTSFILIASSVYLLSFFPASEISDEFSTTTPLRLKRRINPNV